MTLMTVTALRIEKGVLYNPEEKHGTDQTAKKQSRCKNPLVPINGSQKEIPFTEEPAGGGYPYHRETNDDKSKHGIGHLFMKMPELVDIPYPCFIIDGTDDEKKAGHHKGIVNDMKNGTGKAVFVGHPDTEGNVAHLGHNNIGEHSFKILLGKSHQTSRNNSNNSNPADNCSYREHCDGKFRPKDRK